MESLQYLLNHPFIVLNNVSEVLYQQKTTAFNARLRSRAIGRHRFREDEWVKLAKIFSKLSNQLTKIAQKLEGLPQNDNAKKKTVPLDILYIPMLNVKQLLSKSVENTPLNYFRIYDSLRNRTKLNENDLKPISAALLKFSEEIQQHLEQAKKEAKSYPFVLGRGSKSHLLS